MTVDASDRNWINGIAGREIVTIGDPRLTAPASLVEDPSEVADLLAHLVNRLRSLNGAGLARSATIAVEYLSPSGQHHTDTFTGYVARVIQHEVDHLAATVYLHRMDSLASLTTVPNYLTYHRRMGRRPVRPGE